MFPVIYNQGTEVLSRMGTFTVFPLAVKVSPDGKMEKLLADLSPDTSWGDRKIAAQKLGYMGNPAALPGLLAALPADPFWMVRYAIIQALVMIGDPAAVPTLREVAENDGFQVVRSYAAKAIKQLSQKREERES
ncbi:HEAT repeat domain-containing protein [Chloroflexota bacterium]